MAEPLVRRGDAPTAFTFLQEAIKTGGHDWQEICRKIDEYHCQVWIIETDKPIAALITSATVDNSLECVLGGGTGAKLWARVAEGRLTHFALENGLERLRIFGRKGWQRAFPHWRVMGEEDGLVIMEFAL